MYPVWIVEALNVAKDAGLGRLSGWIPCMMHQFGLELGEEALHGCVVVTVAGATHADLNAILGQKPLVAATGVLAAPVRMMQQVVSLGLTLPERHL